MVDGKQRLSRCLKDAEAALISSINIKLFNWIQPSFIFIISTCAFSTMIDTVEFIAWSSDMFYFIIKNDEKYWKFSS